MNQMALLIEPQNTQYQSFIADYQALLGYNDGDKRGENGEARRKEYEELVVKLLDQFDGGSNSAHTLTDDNKEHLLQYKSQLQAWQNEIDQRRAAERNIDEIEGLYSALTDALFPLYVGKQPEKWFADSNGNIDSMEEAILFLDYYAKLQNEPTQEERDAFDKLKGIIEGKGDAILGAEDNYDKLSNFGQQIVDNAAATDKLNELLWLLDELKQAELSPTGYLDYLVKQLPDCPDIVATGVVGAADEFGSSSTVNGKTLDTRISELVALEKKLDKAIAVYNALTPEEQSQVGTLYNTVIGLQTDVAAEYADLAKVFAKDYLTAATNAGDFYDPGLANGPSASSSNGIKVGTPNVGTLVSDALKVYNDLSATAQKAIDDLFYGPTLPELREMVFVTALATSKPEDDKLPENLDAYKEQAKQAIQKEYDSLLSKCDSDQQRASLETAKSNALKAIDAATTGSGIDQAKATGIDNMRNATKIMGATAAQKKAAKDRIWAEYYALVEKNGDKYTDEQKMALDRARDNALRAIDNMVYERDLVPTENAGITAMRNVPVGGVSQKDRDDAKKAIWDEYNRLLGVNGGRYTSAQKAALESARDAALKAIDSASDKAVLDNAVNSGINAMRSVPVGYYSSSGSGGSSGVISEPEEVEEEPKEEPKEEAEEIDDSDKVIIEQASEGTLNVSDAKPEEGEQVIISVAPGEGLELDTLQIIDEDGNEVAYTDNGDGTYTYRQPGGVVTISATFRPVEVPEVVEEDPSDVSEWLITEDHIAYVSGRGNNMFFPNANVVRAEAVAMFFNLLRDKDVVINKNFPDVAENAWYYKAVGIMASLGVVAGYPDGDFRPDAAITRAEFTAIAVKFARATEGDMSFDDVPENHWAYNAIGNASRFAWVNGVGDGYFEPDRNITRAEAVVLINNVLKRSADKGFIDGNSSLIRFDDVVDDHWAYYSIIEASNAHDFVRDGTKESWVENSAP